MLLAFDFSGRIYVKVPSEQRSFSFEPQPVAPVSLPYSPEALKTLAQQWVDSGVAVSDNRDLMNNLDQYDSLELAGFKIALLAIYGNAEPKALLWLKASGSKEERLTRVTSGQEFNAVLVESINNNSVVLRHNGNIQQLQLFKPVGTSQSGNTNLNEQN